MSQILKDYPIKFLPTLEAPDNTSVVPNASMFKGPRNFYAIPAVEGQGDVQYARVPGIGNPAGGYTYSPATGSSIRGIRFLNGKLCVVSGTDVYFDGVKKNGATVLTGTDKCWMIDNGVHVGIGTAAGFYAVNAAGFTDLSASIAGGCCGATYQDGYGIIAEAGTEKFWLTGLDDMTTIGALDFSTADVFADTLMGIESDHRELYLFGKKSIEVWYNSGAASFPFSRAQGGFVERGCASGYTVAKADHKLFWLGDDMAVWMMQGYQPTRISPERFSSEIYNGITTTADFEGFSFYDGGHPFYALTAKPKTGNSKTYVYDIKSGLWHVRQSTPDGSSPDTVFPWEGRCYERTDGSLGCNDVFGLRSLGWVATRDSHLVGIGNAAFTGTEPSYLVSQVLRFGGKRFAVNRFVLDLEREIGASAGDPDSITLTIGGVDRTLTKPITHLIQWNRLGSHRETRVTLKITDAIQCMVRGAYADIEVFDS